LSKVASSGQALRNCEVRVVSEDGTSTDLLGNVEPLLDDDGRPRGAIAVLCDITERKRAEAALCDREQQLASIYNTASPRPRPENLVVKNGSKILACVSGDMPQPVSDTSSCT